MIISNRIDVFEEAIVVLDVVGSLACNDKDEGGDGNGNGNDDDGDDDASGGDDGGGRNVDDGGDDNVDDIWWSKCRQSLYKKTMLSVLVLLDPFIALRWCAMARLKTITTRRLVYPL